MVRRKQDVAIIVLKCVIFGYCASAQQAASGTGVMTPSKPAVGGYVLVAQADKPAEPQAIVQETKNADTPAEPQAVMQEIKSAARLSGSKQRRRKPKMAGVPAGSQVAVKETTEPEPQAVVKETKETESQTVAREAEETDTLDKPLAEAQETKNADASAKAEAKALKVAGAGKKKYGMAPIRWGVAVSETIGMERHLQTLHPAIGPTSSSRSNGVVNTQTAEIQAKTYILQPYIAQLSGKLGVVSSRNGSTIGMSSPSSTIGASGVNDSRNNRLFGDGSLSLFSQSRFPFTMSMSVDDNRNDTELLTQDMVFRRLSLDQTYRPMGSNSTYTGGYNQDTRITTFNNLSTLRAPNPNDTTTHSFWRGGYSTYTPEHRINATARYNDKTTGSTQNVSLRTDNFMVSDSYLPPDSLLSLNSVASINLSDDTNLRASYLQANTNANWQPQDEDIPLFVDGNVRLFTMMSTMKSGIATPLTKGGVDTSSQSLSGNVNARYLLSEKLTGYASGGVTKATSNGNDTLITSERGSVTYSSKAVKLWENSAYFWHANGGAASGSGKGSDSSVFGGVGHNLGVPYRFDMLSKKFIMNSRIDQSLDTKMSQVDGRSITLRNGGSVSLSSLLASVVRPNKELLGGYGTAEGAVDTTATLSVNDTRTIGGKAPSHSRSYSLALNLREASKSAYSLEGIEVEATLGAAQGTTGTEISGTGTARYKKAGVFNVRGLDYVGSLKINTRSSSRAVDANAQNPRFPWELDQRLRYKIGQNEVLLRGYIGDQYGVKNASLWLLFRAWRIIGN